MSEVEKLRALLAEARGLIDRNRLVLGEYETPREVAAIRKAIDAALAEPVKECPRCEESEHQMHLRIRAGYDKTIADAWRAKVVEVERERDEARAYADRLAANLAEGALPKDIDVLRAANSAMAQQLHEARAVLLAICSEFDGAVAHADWRAAGSPGMSVPFTGDFASATQLPSVVSRMRWWAREMRRVIGEKKP
jgi:hypothetical protein